MFPQGAIFPLLNEKLYKFSYFRPYILILDQKGTDKRVYGSDRIY